MRDVRTSAVVEGAADRAHLPVHHAGRRHDVDPGLGVGRPRSARTRSSVASLSTARRPAAPRSGRGRCTRTGTDPRSARAGRPPPPAPAGRPAARSPSGSHAADPASSLCAGMPNRITPGTPSRKAPALFDQAAEGMLLLPGQRLERHRPGQPFLDEQRRDQIGRLEHRLAHHCAQRWAYAAGGAAGNAETTSPFSSPWPAVSRPRTSGPCRPARAQRRHEPRRACSRGDDATRSPSPARWPPSPVRCRRPARRPARARVAARPAG